MDKITINELKIYSPIQVFFGSCLFGPITMIYFLWQNFKTLGQAQEARNTLIIGIVFIFVLIACLEFIPKEIPGYVIQRVYSLFALLIAHSLQMTKKDIDEAPNYSTQSPWRVLAYGLGLYLAWAAITLPYYQYQWNL
jgi:hypothetical protein